MAGPYRVRTRYGNHPEVRIQGDPQARKPQSVRRQRQVAVGLCEGNPARHATASEAIAHRSKLRAPALAGGAAIAGILGGIALGAKALPHKRRRFSCSVSVDLDKLDINKTRKQVARASKQFGDFTRELRKAGEQAERVGRALD